MTVRDTVTRLGVGALIALVALGLLVLAGLEEVAGWVAAVVLVLGGIVLALQAARSDLAAGRRRGRR